jgi:phosphate transport system substrate-binding protein
MTKIRRYAGIVGAALALTMVAAACGDSDDPTDGSTDGGEAVTGSLNISGSSTVEPITSLVAEKFSAENPAVDIAVDGPGTSDGFELFCNGETDVSDASRQIDEEEVAACEANGVDFIELEIAQDALSVIGNPGNTIECLSFGDLYSLFGPESTGFASWSEANDLAAEVGGNGGFPDAPLTIVAPGEESGTYGSFIELVTEGIAEERGIDPADVLRDDYQSSGDDNVIVENAGGTEGGLGFVGFAYAVNAGDSVKSFQVDGGSGCVAPSAETVQDGSYPIARSLYIYVSVPKLADNPALAPFIDFYLDDEGLASVDEAEYVSLPADRIEATREVWASNM